MKKTSARVLLFLMPLFSLSAYGQSWDEIQSSPDYLVGEGHASTLEEADQMALADLVSRISINLSSQWDMQEVERNMNGNVDSKTVMNSIVKSYSGATLTNTGRFQLSQPPSAHVARYIKKAELSKIFKQRQEKIVEFIEAAERAVSKGKVDEALRNYYWALALVRSLQYPNKEKYNGHILTSWLVEKMNEVLDAVRISVTGREEDHVDLAFTFSGRPVNSLDFTYNDGGFWSNICSAQDGRGSIEIDPSDESSVYQLQVEYRYEGQSKLDPEVNTVIKLMKGTALRKSFFDVKSTPVAKAEPTAPVQTQEAPTVAEDALDVSNPQNTFTDVKARNYKPVTQMELAEATPYLEVINQVEGAIRKKQYESVRALFTPHGWTSFRKLVQYGKGRVIGQPKYAITQLGDDVFVRGMQMNFSFATGVRKTFVEDVVFTLNAEKKVDNIAFGLGKTTENDILTRAAWPEETRLVLQNFMENYKTAYALKDIEHLRSIFAKNALIIVGNMVRDAGPKLTDQSQRLMSSALGEKKVNYVQYDKESFMKRLEASFRSKEYINLRFNDSRIRRSASGGDVYGIELSQDYYSNNYSDHGYLFLMIDMNDKSRPLIRVRTWQPEPDPEFGYYDLDRFPIY